jgi:hypothetical protein
MQQGRLSDAYAQFLYSRFLRRYNKTCSVKIECTEDNCKNFIAIPGSDTKDIIYLQKYFTCHDCDSSKHE